MHPFTDPVLAADIFETARTWTTSAKTVVSGAAIVIVSVVLLGPMVKNGFSIGRLLLAIVCGGLALWFINGGGMDWLTDLFNGTANATPGGK